MYRLQEANLNSGEKEVPILPGIGVVASISVI